MTTKTPSAPLIFLLAIIFFSLGLQAQNDELRQKVKALKTDFEESYEMKYLNIKDPDMGYIDDTDPEWKDKFMLKSREKIENNLGNRGYSKFYFSVYSYPTLLDRQYALSDWLEDFIGHKKLRPGRNMRTYDYAKPTIILINDLSIITLTYACSDYTEENFKLWKKSLLDYFKEDNTMVIEVLCDGPLEWTKNAPDPRTTRGLF